jgi:hypothetical protein
MGHRSLYSQGQHFPLLVLKTNQYLEQKINDSTHHKYTASKLRISNIHSQLMRKFANLFKHINISIVFRNTNTMCDLLKPKIHLTQNEYAQSGIYELTCSTRKCSCVRQTGRSLKQRYQEQVRHMKHNNPQSAYTMHFLNNLYEYRPINNTVSLLIHVQKGTYMKFLEQFYVRFYNYKNEPILEQCIEERNPLYQNVYDLQLRHAGT